MQKTPDTMSTAVMASRGVSSRWRVALEKVARTPPSRRLHSPMPSTLQNSGAISNAPLVAPVLLITSMSSGCAQPVMA